MAYLALSNGKVFEGQRIGAAKDCAGELVFTTGVVGYLETLTDPCYAGQIVMQTFPLIGNYGAIEEDLQGEPQLQGYVVRELCDTPSNFRSQYELDAYLKKRGVCGICGVDTREITRILRQEGPLCAMICDEPPHEVPLCKASAAFSHRNKTQVYPAAGETLYHVVMVDYGARQAMIRSLCERGCEVKAVPAETCAEAILNEAPDGVILSAGPELLLENSVYAAQLKELIGKVPVLGIGLGHLLAAQALGGRIVKMQCGHHGCNQPVKELASGRAFMTMQNHGYALDTAGLPEAGSMFFQNLNDGTCEGMMYRAKRCFTVQFEPDEKAGSTGTGFVFDLFLALMGGKTHAQR